MGIFRTGVVLSLVGGMLTWAAAAGAQDYKVKVTPRPSPSPAAQSSGSGEDSGAASDETPGSVGGYAWSDAPKGASKGTRTPRRRVPRIKTQYDHGTPIVTYPGFRILADGTTLIWVTVSKTVPVRDEIAKGRVSYFLDGAHVQVWNNTNPLVTTHFQTPVSRTKLDPGETGARLVVELREDVEPTHEIVSGPRGTMVLRIRVPRSTPPASTPPPSGGADGSRPQENMAATAPDPEPALDGRGSVSASAHANVEAEATLSLSSKKQNKKKGKRKRKRKRHK